mmetsp:Transcript_10160/g.12212  ORF Transcript_10160/g.12212 Transcript_10160/m.12212 type:complete len:106 (+) Transcript_10160:704-1021(+)
MSHLPEGEGEPDNRQTQRPPEGHPDQSQPRQEDIGCPKEADEQPVPAGCDKSQHTFAGISAGAADFENDQQANGRKDPDKDQGRGPGPSHPTQHYTLPIAKPFAM